MAITYPLSLPAVNTQKHVTLRANSAVGSQGSPFTFEETVYAHQGERWEAAVQLAPMKNDEAEEWVGFLLALNGREGTFLMSDPAYRMRGAGTGTPLVNGASQSGKTLLTNGWTPDVTGILKTGDLIQLGTGSDSRIHKLVQAADSDSGGNATLEIWPRLRASPADNAAITLSSPVGLWRLASNVREWSIGGARIYGIQFEAVEAL